jgi:hypothetical protein
MGMGFDRWLGLSGLIVGLVAVWAAYYFYRKTVRAKVLSIGYTEAVPLLIAAPEIESSYHGTAIDSLWLTFVLFWNTGSGPIESSDFIQPVRIKAPSNILDLHVEDKDAATLVNVPSPGVIDVKLLRPGEAIVLRVLSTGEDSKLDLSLVMKTADMSAFVRVNRTVVALAAVSVLGFVFFLVAGFYFDYVIFPNDTTMLEKVLKFSVLIGLLIATVVACFYLHRVLFRLLKSNTPTVVWNFFELSRRALRTRDAARTFRGWLANIMRTEGG